MQPLGGLPALNSRLHSSIGASSSGRGLVDAQCASSQHRNGRRSIRHAALAPEQLIKKQLRAGAGRSSSAPAGLVVCGAQASPIEAEPAPSEGLVAIPIVDPTKPKKYDGSPHVNWVYLREGEVRELQSVEAAAKMAERAARQKVEQAIVQQDLHRLDVAAPSKPKQKAEVPGYRVITDPAELELIGSGLPVIQGVSGAV